MSKGRVVLAMSGGVDSSVAACLLAEEGYDVVGLFMRTGAHDEAASSAPQKIRGCCSAIDAADARRVADQLGLPFYALNFSEDFTRIKDYFVDEYLRGRTPNPCVVCNTWLKFGRLWQYAEGIGADFIATGHYAQRIDRPGGQPELHRAVDLSKDQSYFLFGIRPEILFRILFPIGHLTKPQVRDAALRHGLCVSQKPESQEVCFVPSGNYQQFIRSHRPETDPQPGEIVDVEGRKVAQHEGISQFTIGQRKGLGVAFGEPRYVLELRPESQQVVIGPRELLARTTLEADQVQWLTPSIPTEPIRAEVKIRYLHTPAPATVHADTERTVRVEFDAAQNAITPGQAVVFYQGTRVLGGGWIR